MIASPLKISKIASVCTGQAMTELLITASVLVPLLLMLGSFSNLLDLNTTALKASRFAAWERTAYSVNNMATSTELNDHIEKNIDKLILNRNWTDFGPGKELATLPSMLKIKSTVDGKNAYSTVVPTDAKGLLDGFDVPSRQDNRFEFEPEVFTSSTISIPINEDYSLFKAVKMLSYNKAEYQDMSAPTNNVNGAVEFSVSGSDAIIANSWLPEDEADFQDKVASGTVDGDKLGGFEQAGGFGSSAISWLGFQEMNSGMGEEGTSTVAKKQSEILPDYEPVTP